MEVMICTAYLLRNVLPVWPIYFNGQCRYSFPKICQHKQTINKTNCNISEIWLSRNLFGQ